MGGKVINGLVTSRIIRPGVVESLSKLDLKIVPILRRRDVGMRRHLRGYAADSIANNQSNVGSDDRDLTWVHVESVCVPDLFRGQLLYWLTFCTLRRFRRNMYLRRIVDFEELNRVGAIVQSVYDTVLHASLFPGSVDSG